MTILIDFTQIPRERTGVGVYAEHLLRELPSLLGAQDRLIVLLQSDEAAVPAMLHGVSHPVQTVTIPARPFRNRVALLLFEQCLLPLLLLRLRVNLVHSLHYTHPLWAPCARAVTIHDLTFSLFPQLHTRGRRLLFPFFTRRAVRHAECPLFVSYSTRRDAEQLFGACRHTGHVAPLGVLPPDSVPDPQAAQALLAAAGVRSPFLLFLGTLEPRKNIVRIVQAFEQIADEHPELTLVLAGKLGWHTDAIVAAIESSPQKDRIQRLGFVSEDEKAALLSGCEVLLYPSLYEGFGLPVLEAMAYGAPVVTSNLSSLPEVAGDAALLVDPLSVDAIAGAAERILRDSGAEPALAARLRHAGPERALKFTWRATAEATVVAYRAACPL